MTLMAAEIAESGAAAERCLRDNAATFAALALRLRARDPAVVVTIARGSSDHCALYLKYLVEIVLGLPCASIGPSISSLYRAPLRLTRAVAVSISQSGRSPDIVAVQAAARAGGALTLAFVNDAGVAAGARGADADRAFGRRREVGGGDQVDDRRPRRRRGAGRRLGRATRRSRRRSRGCRRRLGAPRAGAGGFGRGASRGASSAFVLGRGATFAIAAEAALKLKETCALHAEAFSAAEVMHGPAEIVRPGFLVLAFLPADEAAAGFDAALARFRALGARVIVIEAGAEDGGDRLGAEDAGHPLLAPITMVHRFYALAEAAARALGRDPDRPRNLRKITETR